jgi:hypothetical protein
MTHFRVKYAREEDGYIHVKLFSAPREDATFQSHGGLRFGPVEWENFRRCLQGNAGKHNTVTVIADRVPVTMPDPTEGGRFVGA